MNVLPFLEVNKPYTFFFFLWIAGPVCWQYCNSEFASNIQPKLVEGVRMDALHGHSRALTACRLFPLSLVCALLWRLSKEVCAVADRNSSGLISG